MVVLSGGKCRDRWDITINTKRSLHLRPQFGRKYKDRSDIDVNTRKSLHFRPGTYHTSSFSLVDVFLDGNHYLARSTPGIPFGG